MKHSLLALLLIMPGAYATEPVAIAVHGGAGTMAGLDPGSERLYRHAMVEATKRGHQVLSDGGTALAAVQASVVFLEDSPLFNAGRGAVFNHEGINELDAAIMDGKTLSAGAVAALRRVKNPILAAHAVMTASPHVLMFGEGAEQFAAEQRLEFVEPSYFSTPRRLQQLHKAIADDKAFGLGQSVDRDSSRFFSTVGAVARDRQGNLAAATSTGGMNNKRFGRVGDVPVIGAGTYANNETCAVSATGHGEYFIRSVVAHDICAQMEYRGVSLSEATHAVVMEKLVQRGAQGGVIAVDGQGQLSLVFNTPGMYRAAIDGAGIITVGIYAGDEVVVD